MTKQDGWEDGWIESWVDGRVNKYRTDEEMARWWVMIEWRDRWLHG